MSQRHKADPQSSCPAPACRKATPAPDLAARVAALEAALRQLTEAATRMHDHFGVLEDNPLLHKEAVGASKALRAALSAAEQALNTVPATEGGAE